MRILIDGRLYGLENAGLGRYIINLVTELTKIDTENDYVLLLRKKYFTELNLPKNWKKVLADYRHYSLSEQVWLPVLIKGENPDLTHFPHFNVPFFFNGKFIVTIHDMLMHNFAGLSATTLPAPFYFFKKLIYKFVFRRAIMASAKIIVPSGSVKKDLVDYYHINSDKVVVTHEGFDEKIGNQSFDLPTPYFVYAGNAYPHKNLSQLIKATQLLNREVGKKIVLAIASARNVFTGRLSVEVRKLNAGNVVRLLGFVPDEKLGSLYKNSVGFVFPSVSEGFGLPGLEALSSGTLLLASDTPVFKEIYNGAADYFNPLDVSSIKSAMKSALEMAGITRQERIKSGQKFVKKYSWAKMAKETLKIYAQSGHSI